MSRQRDTGRRWRVMWAARRRAAPDTVSLLDSISLTAIMTDPGSHVLFETPPSGDTTDLLATISAAGGQLETPVVATPREPRRAPWGKVSLRTTAVTAVACLLLSCSLVVGGVIGSTSATTTPPAHVVGGPLASRLAVHATHLDLPLATTAAAPAPPTVAEASTSAHEVFGYAPYWSLPQSSSFPVGDFTTIAYFSVDVNANGSIDQSGPGWEGYESQDLVDLVSRAHQAGDRVVLTATDFSQASLDTLTHDPGAGVILGTSLLELVQTKGLDGVNLDLEGVGSADQAGLDRLVSQVSFILHLADPHYQVTMATYASSASDPNGFYDIRGLAPSVDAFFVMAYDVSQGTTGQASENGGGIDATYINEFMSAVPPSKVILGVPLFGYDVPTSGPDLGDSQTGTAQPVTYAQAMSSGPTYWDAATDTAWTAYQTGGQWHQVFFDNANTFALKVQLAANSNLLGIGVWALGMEGNDASVLSVLDGGAPPLRLPPVGPTTVTSSSVQTDTTPSPTLPPATSTISSAATSGGHRHRGAAESAAKSTTTTTSAKATTKSSTTTSTTSKASGSSATTSTVPASTTTTSTSTPGGTTTTTTTSGL